jgi:hypothetical protein
MYHYMEGARVPETTRERETTTTALYRDTAMALKAVADWRGLSMAEALERVAGKLIRTRAREALAAEREHIDLGENGGA